MNASRRKSLSDIWWRLDEIQSELDGLIDEEEAAFENLPESIQSSERGEEMQRHADAMRDAKSNVDSAIEELQQYQQ